MNHIQKHQYYEDEAASVFTPHREWRHDKNYKFNKKDRLFNLLADQPHQKKGIWVAFLFRHANELRSILDVPQKLNSGTLLIELTNLIFEEFYYYCAFDVIIEIKQSMHGIIYRHIERHNKDYDLNYIYFDVYRHQWHSFTKKFHAIQVLNTEIIKSMPYLSMSYLILNYDLSFLNECQDIYSKMCIVLYSYPFYLPNSIRLITPYPSIDLWIYDIFMSEENKYYHLQGRDHEVYFYSKSRNFNNLETHCFQFIPQIDKLIIDNLSPHYIGDVILFNLICENHSYFIHLLNHDSTSHIRISQLYKMPFEFDKIRSKV